MPIPSKLIRYIFGFLLGTLLVVLLFGKRSFSCLDTYLPEGRVLHDLSLKGKVYVIQENNVSMTIDTAYFKNTFLPSAKVNFSKSDVKRDSCKQYFLTNDSLNVIVNNCKQALYIIKVAESKD